MLFTQNFVLFEWDIICRKTLIHKISKHWIWWIIFGDVKALDGMWDNDFTPGFDCASPWSILLPPAPPFRHGSIKFSSILLSHGKFADSLAFLRSVLNLSTYSITKQETIWTLVYFYWYLVNQRLRDNVRCTTSTEQ